MNALIDGVARFGGNSDIMKRATIALQQMAGKGVVSMEELRQQLGEAIPTAMKNMADGMGVTLSKLTKQVSNGTVEAQNAINVMLTEMHLRYGGAAEQLMKTVSGTLAQVETSFAVLADKLGKAGYNDLARNILLDIKSALNSQEVEAFAMSFLSAMQTVVASLKDMFNWVMDNRYAITEIGKVLLMAFAASATLKAIKGVIGLFGGLYSAIRPIGTGLAFITSSMLKFGATSAQVGACAASMTTFGGAISGALASWKALDMAVKFSVIGTVLTVIAGIAYTVYKAFGDVDGKLQDIIKRGKELPGSLSDDDMKKLAKSSEEAAKKLENLEKKLKKYQEAKAKGERVVETGEYVKQGVDYFPAYQSTDEAIKQSSKEEIELRRAAEEQKRILADNAREIERRKVERQYVILEEKSRDHLNNLRKDYNDYADEISRKRMEVNNNDALNYEQKNAERLELDKQMQAKRLEMANAEMQMYVDLQTKADAEVTHLREAMNGLDPASQAYAELNGQLAAATRKSIEYKAQLQDIVGLVKTIQTAMNMGILNIDGLFSKDGENVFIKQSEKWISQFDKVAAAARSKGSKWFDGSMVGGRQEQLLLDKINDTLEEMGTSYDKLAGNSDQSSKILIANWNKARESARMADSANKGAGTSASKLTSEYNKAINTMNAAEQLVEKLSMRSTEVVKFDQQVEKLRASLVKLANATPNGKIDKNGNVLGVTPEQIEEARNKLQLLNDNVTEYRNNLIKTSTLNLINTKIPFADTVIGSLKRTTAEVKIEFEKQYEEADKMFKKLIAAYEQNSEERKIIEERYQLFLRSKNDAMVEQVGTNCEKMIKNYSNVAESIDNYFTSAFEEFGDTLTDFITTGKADWADFSNYLYSEFMKIIVKTQLIAPLMQMLGLGSDATAASGAANGGWLGSLGSLFNLKSGNDGKSDGDKATGVVGAVAGATDKSEKGVFDTINDMFSTASTKMGEMWDSASSGFGNFFSNMGSTASSVWDSISSIAGDVWGSIGDGFGSVIDFVGSGFSSLLSSLTGGSGGGFWSTIGSGFSAMFGGGGGASVTPHANGGVMTSAGPLPLKKYARGGIADKPQLALFGEGSLREAFVPLPDGRSIPVSFKNSFSDSMPKSLDNSTSISSSEENNSRVSIAITIINSADGNSTTDENMQESDNAQQNAQAKSMVNKITSIVQQELGNQRRVNGIISQRNLRRKG